MTERESLEFMYAADLHIIFGDVAYEIKKGSRSAIESVEVLIEALRNDITESMAWSENFYEAMQAYDLDTVNWACIANHLVEQFPALVDPNPKKG